jgi:hypothetical protein
MIHTSKRLVAGYVIVSGIAGLSMMPHQEPRFLMPVLAPLVIALTPRLGTYSKYFWASKPCSHTHNILTIYLDDMVFV